MIKITIVCNEKGLFEELETEKTTLVENAMVVRKLEEFKLELLDDFEYPAKVEVEKNEDE